MNDFLVGYTIAFMFQISALLIGFKLGRMTAVYDEQPKGDSPKATMKHKIDQIFKRVVPEKEIGPVERPDVKQNYYRDHPEEAEMDGYMTRQFDDLNKK